MRCLKSSKTRLDVRRIPVMIFSNQRKNRISRDTTYQIKVTISSEKAAEIEKFLNEALPEKIGRIKAIF
jgi:hypothetical protein